MSQSDRSGAGASPPAKATETLSQFLARVLDQLSMSAWLPSAALVSLIALAFATRRALDEATAAGAFAAEPAGVVTDALAKLSGIGLGGAIVGIGAVVILTMVTQAFVFDAIRFFEGYWGPSIEFILLADRRCAAHAARRASLDLRHKEARARAWEFAEPGIRRDAASRGPDDPGRLNAAMVKVLRATVISDSVRTSGLTAAQIHTARHFPWRTFASPALLRPMDSLERVLRDYPTKGRENPTRLGNILRAYEDETGVRRLESFVRRVFEALPLSIQVDHDDVRNRLDLYVSMIFVLVAGGVISVGALAPHWAYAAAFALCTVGGSALSYRAALASAREYGPILVMIVDYVRDNEPGLTTEISA